MDVVGWIFCNLETLGYTVQKLLDSAPEHNIDIRLYSPHDIYLSNKKDRIVTNKGDQSLPDFFWAVSPTDVSIVQHIEDLGVLPINKLSGYQKAIDKLHTYQLAANLGIPIPKTVLLRPSISVDFVLDQLKLPVVFKPIRGSLGRGVNWAQNTEELLHMMSRDSKKDYILIQEFISNPSKSDFRIFVVDGCPIYCVERPVLGDGLISNYTLGGSYKEISIIPDAADIAVRITKAMGLTVAGVDVFFNGSSYVLCEVNSCPRFYKRAKSEPDAIYKYVRSRLC